MNKLIVAIACITGLTLVSNDTFALKGWTRTERFANGSRTYCDPDESKTCTLSQSNPDGTTTIVIYNYDKAGNLTGATTVRTHSAEAPNQPDPANGYTHLVETDNGSYWCKVVAQ